MNPKDFRSSEGGRVVKLPEGFHAFVPAPLPPKLDFDAALALAKSHADTALR